jgi:hypothetical protein
MRAWLALLERVVGVKEEIVVAAAAYPPPPPPPADDPTGSAGVYDIIVAIGRQIDDYKTLYSLLRAAPPRTTSARLAADGLWLALIRRRYEADAAVWIEKLGTWREDMRRRGIDIHEFWFNAFALLSAVARVAVVRGLRYLQWLGYANYDWEITFPERLGRPVWWSDLVLGGSNAGDVKFLTKRIGYDDPLTGDFVDASSIVIGDDYVISARGVDEETGMQSWASTEGDTFWRLPGKSFLFLVKMEADRALKRETTHHWFMLTAETDAFLTYGVSTVINLLTDAYANPIDLDNAFLPRGSRGTKPVIFRAKETHMQ